MSSASVPLASARPSAARAALVLAGAVAVAVALNAVVAAVAIATGAPATYGPLLFPVYAAFTALAMVVGWFGWTLVRRRSTNPRRVLTILVVAVTVVSLVPDAVLLVTGFIPGTTPGAAIALAIMHLVVVAVAVPAYALAAPVGGSSTR